MTRNRWTSLLAGTGITAVIQSSSVTTVLAVGFVSAGLISFQSTLGLILGANVGTTITAQIIAFKITKASWLMIAFGFLFSAIFSKKSFREIGTIILGLGLVFLGMNVMSEATGPLKTYEPFIRLMKGLDNYLWGILIGAVFTAAVQSSSATTGVVIIMASQGLISIEAGIAIILGANIGTCVTAVLSAFGKPKDAMRVAFSHIFFNVAGVLLWFAFIKQLSVLVGWLSEDVPARQIANAHTIFNLVNTVVFIWLVKPVSKLVLWLLPKKKKKQQKLFPELHDYYTENPSLAIDLANNAIVNLGNQSLVLIEKGIDITLKGNLSELHLLRKGDERVDQGQEEILTFLRSIKGNSVSEKEMKRLEQQIEAVNILETAADLITSVLVEAAEHRIEYNLTASAETSEKLTGLYRLAYSSFKLAIKKFSGEETEDSDKYSKENFKAALQKVRSYLSQRLAVTKENQILLYRFESEVLESIRRLHSLSRRLVRKAEWINHP